MAKYEDRANAAKSQFKKALRAHLRALKALKATQEALNIAENALYREFVMINDEYRSYGVEPELIKLPSRILLSDPLP